MDKKLGESDNPYHFDRLVGWSACQSHFNTWIQIAITFCFWLGCQYALF